MDQNNQNSFSAQPQTPPNSFAHPGQQPQQPQGGFTAQPNSFVPPTPNPQGGFSQPQPAASFSAQQPTQAGGFSQQSVAPQTNAFQNTTPQPPGFNPSINAPSSGFSMPSNSVDQGANYVPDPFSVGDSGQSTFEEMGDVVAENEPQNFLSSITKDKKKFAIMLAAGIAVVVLVIAVVIIAVTSGGNEEAEQESVSEEFVDWDIDNPGTVYETASTPPAPPPEPVPETQFPLTEAEKYYTVEAIQALRDVGFTMEEIDQFARDERKDLRDIITEQERTVRAYYLEQYEFLLNRLIQSNQGAQKEAILNTWYGLLPLEIGDAVVDEYGYEEAAVYELFTENVNYEKMPLLGNQTILKLTLNDGMTVFYMVDPERYLELEKDAGNMVVEYNTISFRGAVFIHNIREKRIDR